MAEATPPSATTKEANSEHSEPENPNPLLNQVEEQAATIQQPQAPSSTPPQPPTLNPNPNPVPPNLASMPAPTALSVNPYGGSLPPAVSSSGAVAPPHATPSFRPAAAPAPIPPPQFAPMQSNPNPPIFQSQNPGVPPPGVSSASGMVPTSVQPPQMVQTSMYPVPAGQHPASVVRPPFPNGYMPPMPQGTMPPPGVARYPFAPMVRPRFPPLQPGPVGLVPPLPRPLIPIRPPVIPPVVRPAVTPVAAPAEKPETTVYVGKISTTVENEFMRSLLDLCGQVKSWKRAQDPSNGTPRGFGFCEFESAEGILRALRLLNKLSVDGQELGLNVKQATKEYLERYVEKKKESLSKPKEAGIEEAKTGEESAPDAPKSEDKLKNDISKPSAAESKKDDHGPGSNDNIFANFGLLTDEDREADSVVLEKLTKSLEERLKTKPPPPPPPPPAQKTVDSTTNANSEVPAKSGDEDLDVDNVKKADDKNDDAMSETRNAGRAGTESPERGRRYDGRGRERDRERDLKRDKERELERLERERERERDRRERTRRVVIQRAERMYKERLLEWEDRERQRESERKHEKEREKERRRERQKLIEFQEHDGEDDSRKRRRRSEIEERRKRRRREKEDDMADRLKEEEETAEAEKKAEEEQKREKERGSLQSPAVQLANGSEKVLSPIADSGENNGSLENYDRDSGCVDQIGDGVSQNGIDDESMVPPASTLDVKPSSNAPSKKLGFGLMGSGKRTVVPSVFNEEEEEAQKDKKMRPLVPIDYSTEELQAVKDTPMNLAAAAEFAKHISGASSKEEKLDGEMERSRRSHDRSSHREREWGDLEPRAIKDDQRERSVDRDRDAKSTQNRRLLDAKQLIDMIPKTKDELFSYEINWTVYDKHELHEKIKPWISSKITDFLGEEEASLVDYIVDLTRRHCKASQLLELLQSILDEEAEMFVLKMWRMLIFEIKKVETGLAAARHKA